MFHGIIRNTVDTPDKNTLFWNIHYVRIYSQSPNP